MKLKGVSFFESTQKKLSFLACASFIYLFIHLFIYSFIYLFIYLFYILPQRINITERERKNTITGQEELQK